MMASEKASENKQSWTAAKCDPGVPRRRSGDYIWLVYSAFYFVEPAMRHDALYWLQCLAIFAVFLPCYAWYVETKRPAVRLPLIGVIVLFGIATVHFNQGGSFFFIFAAALIPFTVSSLRLGALLIVAESVVVAAQWSLSRENSINFGIAIGMIYVAGVGNLFAAEQKRATNRLRVVQVENATLAAVAERERIARDLHDVLGHTLSVIVLKAELAGRLVERDPDRAKVEIADVERTARTALTEVRETIGGYRAQGLRAEMAMARRALDAAGVVLMLEEIDATGLAPSLDPELQTVLSLTLREAVTNIVRHAHATHCRVSFTTQAGQHALLIEDDGTHPVPREGNGLRGMRERVQRMGGRFWLETGNGTGPGTGAGNRSGTRVRVEIPETRAGAEARQ